MNSTIMREGYKLKYNQSFLIPLIPNPFCHLTVTKDDRLIHKRWGSVLFDQNIRECVPQAIPKGIYGLLGGYGDVVLGQSGSTFTFSNVIGAASLGRALTRRKISPEERSLLENVENARRLLLGSPIISAVGFFVFWLFEGTRDGKLSDGVLPWIGNIGFVVGFIYLAFSFFCVFYFIKTNGKLATYKQSLNH